MAPQQEINLAVVLTNGFVNEAAGDLRPNNAGILRMAVAADLLTRDPDMKLCFSGGIRDNPENSEAEVYDRWFRKAYPHLAERILLVSATAKFTAHDMVELVNELRELSNRGLGINYLALISHPTHTHLARQTIESMSVPKLFSTIAEINSGEPPPYSKRDLAILNMVTTIDPRWETPLTAPLRWLANKRGK